MGIIGNLIEQPGPLSYQGSIKRDPRMTRTRFRVLRVISWIVGRHRVAGGFGSGVVDVSGQTRTWTILPGEHLHTLPDPHPCFMISATVNQN